jgi:poly(A) polymerase
MQVATDKLSDVLRCCPHFDRLLTLNTTNDAYLVGGAIRDGLIGRPITDLDLISASDPTSMARLFAKQIGGHWFWLDKDRLQSRVVVNHEDDCLNYDFALFRAASLELDLLDRDFTINALALSMTETISAFSLIDPFCGLGDLQQGTLRMVGKNAFANDALRIIKGVRHATALGLEIEAETLKAMQVENEGLDRVAPERVRQEVWKTLSDKQAGRGLQLLCECKAGETLFGRDFTCQINRLHEQLKGIHEVLFQLTQSHPIVKGWLAQEIEQGLSNETLLLWTLLLKSIDHDLPIQLADKWLLSRKARANIRAIVALDQVALNEFATIAHNERAFTWWAARYSVDPKLLLLAVAILGSMFPLDAIRTWVPLVARINDQRLSDQVDGHWLRSELGLKEGPEMTKALQLLRNAEIFGQVSNKDDAHRFLVEHYQNKD